MEKPAKKEGYKDFDKLLLEAIDEAFASLGESSKDSIFLCLESTIGIGRREIPSRIEDFSDALYKIFGIGAKCLEILVIKSLHQKLSTVEEQESVDCSERDLTLSRYVAAKRLAYQNSEGVKFEPLLNAKEQRNQKVCYTKAGRKR